MIVKICGLTRPDDAVAAASLGADWIGLNFWSGSRRFVTLAEARAIAGALSATPTVKKVGVFVNASADEIDSIVAEVGLDLVQLHGDESIALAARFAGRRVRAIRMSGASDLFGLHTLPEGTVILLDSPSTRYGGSGVTFDWSLAQTAVAAGRKIMLAGGLTPENVSRAIAEVSPWGVDVAGGVESAPGLKDHDKMRRFIATARHQKGAE